MITRRRLLGAVAVTLVCPALPTRANPAAPRLVCVLLRGGLDGLAAVVPHGDPDYARQRGPLAIPRGALLPLDDLFGLHPSLGRLHRWYASGELLIAHAVATPYRDRSHFDGQAVLENGLEAPAGSASGWLNRAVTAAPGTGAVAIASSVPAILRGPAAVETWAPSRLPAGDEATFARIAALYESAPEFAARLRQATATDALAGTTMPPGAVAGRDRLAASMDAVARLLGAADGPRIAFLDSGGWDTHANEGAATGGLARRLALLDEALNRLRIGLGPTWSSTVVAVVSEFGRTVAANGTGGTDHGTAGVALLAGGRVRGGRVVADWPGLAAGELLEGRDLRPTMDLRRLWKGVLGEHLGIGRTALERSVFPDSAFVPPLEGVIA